MNTHFPSSFAAFAASAAAETSAGGRPARSSLRSTTSRKRFVSFRRFSANFKPSADSSWLISRKRFLFSGARLAPPRTKSLYVSSRSFFCSTVSVSVARASRTALTRAKSFSFRRTSSRSAESFGATSLLIAWSASFVSAPVSVKKTSLTFARARPPFSSASTVFANVGAAGFEAMASTSFFRAAIPASNAGLKCSGLIRSNGGIPKGVVHSSKNGLEGGGACAAAGDATRRTVRATARRETVSGMRREPSFVGRSGRPYRPARPGALMQMKGGEPKGVVPPEGFEPSISTLKVVRGL